MVTNGFLKVDDTFLKTQAIKESEFDATGFPQTLKDAVSILKRPDEATTSSVPSPKLNTYVGIKIGASSTTIGYSQSSGAIAERPQLNDLEGYYFPLGSDLKGLSLSDIRANILKPTPKIEPIDGSFESEDSTEYKNDPLVVYSQGITPCTNEVENLITTSAIKTAWSNATTSSMINNLVSSQDGLSITPAVMTSDTIGTYKITPSSSGYYCFSFYARLDGRSYNALNNVRYLKMNLSPEVSDSYIISEEAMAQSASSILFTLKFEWLRYAAVAYLTAGTQYTITLNWFYRDTSISSTNNNFRASNLKIAGVLIERNKWPSPYDVRKSNVSGTSSISNTIYHLAAFDLDSLYDNISQNKGWIISYKRKIADTFSSNTSHYDSLGDLYWGYAGNQLVSNNFNEEDPPPIAAEDFYLKWEHVILRHEEDSPLVDIYTEATNDNREYHFKVDISEILLRKEFKSQEYNLMLGCRDVDIENISNATYKDLIYIPEGDDSTLQKIKNNTMGLFTSEMVVAVNDVETTSQAIVVTDMNIIEKVNLEY